MVNKMKILLLTFFTFSAFAQTYYYNDGGVKRKIVVSDEFVAQRPTPGGVSARSGTTSSGAVVTGNAVVEIIRKTSIGSGGTGTRSTTTSSSDESMPVFVAENGVLMAVPGGLLIKFKPNLTQATITSWLSSKGLNLKEVISLKNSKYYHVASPAGIASLELVSQLESDSLIKEVKPNFWVDLKSRSKAVHLEKFDPKKR